MELVSQPNDTLFRSTPYTHPFVPKDRKFLCEHRHLVSCLVEEQNPLHTPASSPLSSAHTQNKQIILKPCLRMDIVLVWPQPWPVRCI